jgi:hypothetical protein
MSKKNLKGGKFTLQPTSWELRLILLHASLLVLRYLVGPCKTLGDHLLLPNVMGKQLIRTRYQGHLHRDLLLELIGIQGHQEIPALQPSASNGITTRQQLAKRKVELFCE